MGIYVSSALTHRIDCAEKFLEPEIRLLWPTEFYKNMWVARAATDSFYSFILRTDIFYDKRFDDEFNIYKKNFEHAYSRKKNQNHLFL